jgi:hypothetical protein
MVARPIQRFVRRTPLERRLLLRSSALLLAVTLGLRLMPLVSLQKVARRAVRRGRAHSGDRPSPDTVIWAVTATSRYLPRSTCLARALVLQTLLEVYGWSSRLRVGFGRAADGSLAGHAWVEGPDRRSIGHDTRIPYIPLPLFEEVRSR